MADVDIDPFGDHESRPEEPTGENISLTPGGGSTWKPDVNVNKKHHSEEKVKELDS